MDVDSATESNASTPMNSTKRTTLRIGLYICVLLSRPIEASGDRGPGPSRVAGGTAGNSGIRFPYQQWGEQKQILIYHQPRPCARGSAPHASLRRLEPVQDVRGEPLGPRSQKCSS